jgi:G3E family GTPase
LLEEENNKIAEEIRQEKLKRAAAHHHEHHHHHHHQHHTTTTSKQKEEHSGASYRVKVTWAPTMSEKLTQKALEEIFSKYGHVENFILGAKATKPTALLEFRSRQETKACINDGSALNEQYSIQVKCLDNLESPKRQPEVVVIESSGLDQEETNNGDGESFEDMEARILKKMKSSKN